ncbi:hypothetical protein Ancab_014410 [Ancistrocladus abbreviatus]
MESTCNMLEAGTVLSVLVEYTYLECLTQLGPTILINKPRQLKQSDQADSPLFAKEKALLTTPDTCTPPRHSAPSLPPACYTWIPFALRFLKTKATHDGSALHPLVLCSTKVKKATGKFPPDSIICKGPSTYHPLSTPVPALRFLSKERSRHAFSYKLQEKHSAIQNIGPLVLHYLIQDRC